MKASELAQLDADIRAFVTYTDPPPVSAPGPLSGIAVGVKDIIHVDGMPTGGGSALPPEALAGPQATIITRLLAAGAYVAGKTVTAEFAILAPGPTRNPHNLAHTPGGSSSGSAAAVAAGMVPLAVGTQTVGSMIRPAAYCGVVGFKPTHGRIPIDGVIPNAPSFDTLGLYAPDVAGVAVAASVACDDWTEPEPGPPVLAIPDGPYLSQASPEALAAFAEHVRMLRDAGYEVRRVPVMPDFDAIRRQLFTMNRYEAVRSHAPWFATYGHLYREETLAVLREGEGISDAAYEAACAAREGFRERLAESARSAGVDVWVTPAAPGPAPASLATTGSSVMSLPWSNAGLPSLSLPAGRAANGLPLGVQCVAGAGEDERLLAWAAGLAPVLPG
ncbi:glutamyl-tRNA amidotransferase subunit A [Streptomyces spiroverticillatus]|uniref:Glutamyl-tRNA amidotransferase subunit A n=1 Tax=Streptomyces finlayi TaxID=67296 RepID=A0A919CD55_9ACTN|nr:amidase [Streptomyces finlayi]GHA24582.1 glutamyl-tRNA amidotransferase subunit A [Streptomyces spiroverticillatus]GHD05823.1 glutamyl-tRNA amidotransferase subunit A [Streptomyces finlayi]